MGHWNDIDKRRELFIEHQEHVQGTVVKKKKAEIRINDSSGL